MSPGTGSTRRNGVPPEDLKALKVHPTGAGSGWSGRPRTALIPTAWMADTAASYDTAPRSHEFAHAVKAPPVRKLERPGEAGTVPGCVEFGTSRL